MSTIHVETHQLNQLLKNTSMFILLLNFLLLAKENYEAHVIVPDEKTRNKKKSKFNLLTMIRIP